MHVNSIRLYVQLQEGGVAVEMCGLHGTKQDQGAEGPPRRLLRRAVYVPASITEWEQDDKWDGSTAGVE